MIVSGGHLFVCCKVEKIQTNLLAAGIHPAYWLSLVCTLFTLGFLSMGVADIRVQKWHVNCLVKWKILYAKKSIFALFQLFEKAAIFCVAIFSCVPKHNF